jgi:Type I phosphodiesterase / nucleotide pyrophosphatase
MWGRRPARAGRFILHLLVLLAASAPAAPAQPRVVIVDIDGLRRDTLESVYLSGKLPNFERILGEVRDGKGFGTAVWFENATSVFPTVTMSGQASIFTGVTPARHGVPGNQWFDRASGRVIAYLTATGLPCVYGFLPIGVGDCAGGLANRHLEVPTLYEAATTAGKTSIVVFSQYWKGATHAVLPSLGELALLVQGSTPNCQKFDALMTAHAVMALRQYGLPDILTVYFDGADNVGHQHGTAGQTAYLASTINLLLGKLLDQYEAADKQWRTHTQFVITSDHGRTDAPATPADQSIEASARKAIEGAGFDATHYRVVGDGGMVQVYLRSRAPASRWTDPPPAADILAVAKALSRSSSLEAVTHSVVARTNGPGTGYWTPNGDPVPDDTAALLRAMDSSRTGDVLLLLKQGHYFGNTATEGAQHGSIYPTDRSVPVALALGGVNPGRSPVPLSIADIARIIATYLGFTMNAQH